MASGKLIMSVKNGLIQKSSKVAGKYMGHADNVPLETKWANSTFRDKELFSPYKDVGEFMPTYSFDDVPLSSSLNPRVQQKASALTSQVIDTDLPTAKLLGSNKTVFLETIYTHDSNGNRLILEYIDRGHSFSDAANIINHARGHMHRPYIAEAFSLLEKGYPLELVFKYMDESLLNAPIKYQKGLMEFVANNPNKRNMVIVKDRYFNEVFDAIGAKNYHIFENLCPDEKSLKSVIRACRCKNQEGAFTTNDDLSTLAMEILQRNGKWTDLDSQILKSLKYTYERAKCDIEAIDGPPYNKVLSWVKKGDSTEEIIRKLNHLGVHS